MEKFYCKSHRLAAYLYEHGSRLLRSEFQNGEKIYIFEKTPDIDKNLELWQKDKKKCFF